MLAPQIRRMIMTSSMIWIMSGSNMIGADKLERFADVTMTSAYVTDLRFSLDDKYIVTGAIRSNSTVEVKTFLGASLMPVSHAQINNAGGVALQFLPSNKRLLIQCVSAQEPLVNTLYTSSEDSLFTKFDKLLDNTMLQGQLVACGEDAEQIVVVTAKKGGVVTFVNAATRHPEYIIDSGWPSIPFSPVDVSRSCQYLGLGFHDFVRSTFRLGVWNIKTGDKAIIEQEDSGEIACLVFDSKGSEIAVGTTNGTILSWPVTAKGIASNAKPDRYELPQDIIGKAVRQLVFSPDSSHIAAVVDDRVVLWRYKERTASATIVSGLRRLAFSTRSKKIVVAKSADGKSSVLELWSY